MKITARADYAILAIFELALHPPTTRVQARELAESQEIPLRFLEQILIQLKKAGMVESVRGAAGGYKLACAPREISLARIMDELAAVEAAAPERLLRERDRLRERVAVLSGTVDVDEDRLAREIAYLAERWDIAEEIVRLRSHVALFLESLEAGAGAGGPRADRAGKRLGFVVQEMYREANTVGSKANDAAISASAVAMKEELERMREQLENVE